MGRRVTRYAGREWADPRNTRAWRKLMAQVVAEEPTCWLRLPGVCTVASTTADHVIPWTKRPDLGMERSNLRGACRPCNECRKDRPVSALRRVAPEALRFFE